MTTTTRLDIQAELDFYANDSELFNPEHELFQMTTKPGNPHLAVIAGPNASGKSLFMRAFAQRTLNAGLLPLTFSLRDRTGSGMSDIAGFRKIMVYGDDSTQSTGAGSVSVVRNAIEKNLNREQGCVLLLDEPELGLSDGYARALGRYIGASVESFPQECSGVLVVTHSRVLVQGLIDGSDSIPTFAYLGTEDLTLTEWVEMQESFTVEELLNLPALGHERFLAAQDKILKAR